MILLAATTATEIAAIIAGSLALIGTAITATFQYRGVRTNAAAARAPHDPSSLEGWIGLVNELQEEVRMAREDSRMARLSLQEAQREHDQTRAKLQSVIRHLVELGIPLPQEDTG